MKNLNSVHLNGLRAVEAVFRLGSLQAAAEELGVSIGAVSQQVIKTEKQLGRPLFERHPKGMVATQAGTELLPGLTDAFARLSASLAAFRQRDDSVLTVSVAPVFAARWLVHRLGEFNARFPHIRLRIDATDRLIDPSASDVDLCIRVGRGDWPGMRCELIYEQEVFPVCAPSFLGRITTPADLLELPTVIDGRAMFEWKVWLDEAGLSGRKVSASTVYSEASICLDAAIAGQGVMIVWPLLAAHAIRNGQLVMPFDLRVKTGFSHYFAVPDNARKNRRAETFKDWLRASLRADMAALDADIRKRRCETKA